MVGEPGSTDTPAASALNPVPSEPCAVDCDHLDESGTPAKEDWRSEGFWLVEVRPELGDLGEPPWMHTRRSLSVRERETFRPPEAFERAWLAYIRQHVVLAIDAAATSGLAADPSEQLAMALFLRNATVELRRWVRTERLGGVGWGISAAVAAAVAATYGLIYSRWPAPLWACALGSMLGFVLAAVAAGLSVTPPPSSRLRALVVPVGRYIILALLLALGLASAALTLSIDYPGAFAAAAVAAPAVALVLAAVIAVELMAARLVVRMRLGPDPYIELPLNLADALSLLAEARSDTAYAVTGERAPLPLQIRRELAISLERCARDLQAGGTLTPRLGGGLASEAQAALAARRDRILAWLRETESWILWPSPNAPAEVEKRLITAIVGICKGDWSSLDGEPLRTQRTDRLRRILPRLALTAALLAAAWGVPALLGDALSPSAAATLRVSLIITAVTALIAPANALSTAADTISSLGRRPD